MGSGTMKCKSYRTTKGYYLDKDYDDRLGGEFYFLLLPLYGNDDERYFYVIEENDGYTVEGECYIITGEEQAKKAVRDFRRELRKAPIWYFHRDDQGRVFRKEKHT